MNILMLTFHRCCRSESRSEAAPIDRLRLPRLRAGRRLPSPARFPGGPRPAGDARLWPPPANRGLRRRPARKSASAPPRPCSQARHPIDEQRRVVGDARQTGIEEAQRQAGAVHPLSGPQAGALAGQSRRQLPGGFTAPPSRPRMIDRKALAPPPSRAHRSRRPQRSSAAGNSPAAAPPNSTRSPGAFRVLRQSFLRSFSAAPKRLSSRFSCPRTTKAREP